MQERRLDRIARHLSYANTGARVFTKEQPAMDGKRFDWLAKSFSTSATPSRRHVLGAVLGGLLGALDALPSHFGVPDAAARQHRAEKAQRRGPAKHHQTRRGKGHRARAQGQANQGNATCAHFCNAAVPPGPERGRCKSEAAHGGGLCYACGPQGDSSRVLCGAICCQPGENCVDGLCQVACSATNPCPPCQTCSGGRCLADATQNRTSCGGSSICCNGTCCTGCCARDGSCGACLAFVTSTQHNGDLFFVSGGDRICQQQAQAVALPGTYKAWLSAGSLSAAARFRHSGQPYRLVTGTQIADDWTDLTNGDIDHPINITEDGQMVGADPVWTNTTPSGTTTSVVDDCDNWNSGSHVFIASVGQTDRADTEWTNDPTPATCDQLNRLYCFQQD